MKALMELVEEGLLLEEAKLITCIVPKEKAPEVGALLEQPRFREINFHHARGVGRFTPLARRGLGEQSEKLVVQLTVSAADADSVFEALFFDLEINRPHGGIIYMGSVPLTSVSPASAAARAQSDVEFAISQPCRSSPCQERESGSDATPRVS